MDYYQILEIKYTADETEIKKAYRKKAKILHPDAGGDKVKFQEIADAFETLSDPAKRRVHDRKNGYVGTKGHTQEDFNNPFNYTYSRRHNNFDNYDFSSMFDQMFYNAAYGASQKRNIDVNTTLRLTLDEVYHGVVKKIKTNNSTFSIRIPKGIKDGAKLRVKGKGKVYNDAFSSNVGDVIIHVVWIKNENLIVNGNDIYSDLTINIWDMLLGRECEISTSLFKINARIPANSNPGDCIIIHGGGMPIYKTEKYGNLIIKLKTKKVNLNNQQIELLKQIRKIDTNNG